MESNTCMNMLCRATTSSGWRRGWALRSGQFATLCDNCGSAYAQSNFCHVFHSEESGWRHCSSCDKRLHCGCIASVLFIEILDGGGVRCIGCPKSPEDNSETGDENPDGVRSSKVNDASELQSSPDDNLMDGERKFVQLGSYADPTGMRHILQLQNGETNGHDRQMKQEDHLPSMGEFEGTSFSNFKQESSGISQAAIPEIVKSITTAIDLYDPPVQTNLSITLGPVSNPNAFPGVVIEERAQSKASSSLQQGPRARHLLPKPPKSAIATGLEANAGMVSQIRVARPPVEGRGRNQLLPRYWPRITDQELQQISGDSNSTIVPLFEKVLSASDAGRIGRLVLPKACAEAYFPPISQPEGLPIRIQDVKGKDWVFQFRFWPNNNSRMYVLEGVTPCIQSMQLQAGDTVTFSRMDPEGKLVMGFRKASNSAMMQESPASAIANGVHSSESFFSGEFENLPIINGYSGLLQSLKGRTNAHLSAFSKQLNSAGGDVNWHKSGNHDDQTKKSLFVPLSLIPERKRTRNIGSKSKRLLFDSLDALELKLTWEEIQDLLRPPPSVKPNIITVEDHDFEEYDEPPVFGKRSVFIVRSIGEQEQWAPCDNCSKWRRLPVDFLLPPNWTCNENAWDQKRCSCSAPEELTPSELENLLRRYKDFKKCRLAIYHRADQEPESSGLDALANAAILGDASDPSTTVIATTTKHPRHRPGCSCIVCIQPPSGKGKHKPTCTCNVCMTVKRRFKTLMMRKKKRQSEREAEIAQKNQNMWVPKGEAEVDSSSKLVLTHSVPSGNEAKTENDSESQIPTNILSTKMADNTKGNIDLNCHPDREEDSQAGLRRMSTMSLLQAASLPLETYLKQNGLTSLATEQQASSAPYALAGGGESEGRVHEDCQLAPASNKQESGGEDNNNNNCGPPADRSGSDPV